ncbi:substrate-binding domain-containing protein [Methylobacterium segetis]|uniref:substrate-binding domain-containing protein n=1 Tax=Methylobacterium segetis TaxID=2488750 RepID=UPI001047723E|nr:substrate-binding domain-containing protein [Methylobacterium segetis]
MDILRRSLLSLGLAALLAGPGLAGPAWAEPQTITVASTTSTEQSGLFKHLLPRFTEKTGIGVKVVALGTGQALDVGRRGDADVVFVHDRAAEEKFVAEGFGTKRHAVMYNDFVVAGPKADPAGARGGDVTASFARIAAVKAPFVSRGDRSGTHAAELRYWKEAGLDLGAVRGEWYKDVGQGMGPALNTASAANAYILADRGTWLSFRNRGDLAILVQGDKRLFNQYGVLLVNPEKHPQVKAKEGQAFVDWLIAPDGQRAIADYKIEGEQLFFPTAEAGKS